MDTVRQFGRDNPMGFLAGSLLAGFALSRFATAGMSSGDASTDERKPAGGGAVSQPSMRPQQPPAATPAAQQGGSSAMTPEKDNRSIPELLSDPLHPSSLSSLVRTESSLLRSELRESANRAGTGAMEVMAGAVLLLGALLILLQAPRSSAWPSWVLGVGWGPPLSGRHRHRRHWWPSRQARQPP